MCHTNNIQRLTNHLSRNKNIWQIFKNIIKDNIPHTPSKVGVLEIRIFSHTPEEAMSVGLAKACVPRKKIYSVQEKLSSLIPKNVAGNSPKGNLLENLPKQNGGRLNKILESLNLQSIESWMGQQQHQLKIL